MLTIVLGLASKACKTHNVKSTSEAGIVTGSKWLFCVQVALSCEHPANSFNIGMLARCKSKFRLWDTTTKGVGKFAKDPAEYGGVAGDLQLQLVKVEEGRGSFYQQMVSLKITSGTNSKWLS